MDELLTARLRMRPFAAGDAEAVFAVFSQPEVGRFTGGAHADVERSREMIAANRAHQERHGFSMWAVLERDSARLVGEAGLQLLEREGPDVEIGWAFSRDVWGRGYATEAARAWLDRAFGGLGLQEVIAVIREENAPSHRVAQRLGMEPISPRRAYGRELCAYRARAGAAAPRAAASSASPR